MVNFSGKCPICLGDFLPEQISALKCGHTFHYDCIVQWFKTSKTCPKCRSSATERTLIRQLYFNPDDESQILNSSFSADEESLLKKIAELKISLACEQIAHSSTCEELRTARQENEKLKTLYHREKEKVKNLNSQVAKIGQLEMMLQDKQDLQKKLEIYKARLKATELYTLLAGQNKAVEDSKIDKFLNEKGEPDASKFLDLLRRQQEDTKKRLYAVKAQLEKTEKSNFDLKRKLDLHRNLNVVYREEIVNMHSRDPCYELNPQIKDVVACSPHGPRPSFGFEVEKRDKFSPSVMKSAYKTRCRPLFSTINRATERAQSPILFFDEEEVISSKSSTTLARTQIEEELGTATGWDVQVPVPIVNRAALPSLKKKSNGFGGVAKASLSLNDASGVKKLLASNPGAVKKQKLTSDGTLKPIYHFFGKSGHSSLEKAVDPDGTVVID